MGRRRRRRGENLTGYFRGVFQERPQWLREKSNDLVLARYREDHGLPSAKPIPVSVRNNLANIKSKMRKEAREGVGIAHQRDRFVTATSTSSATGDDRMDQLEEQIDECLTMAKNVDREGLKTIISLLRRARNAVVWKAGQP
jgi:hypothetical protein